MVTSDDISLRELRLGDTRHLWKLAMDPQFEYPFLTGKLSPSRPWAALRRAAGFVFACVIANRLGGLLFGARLHWIMAIRHQGRFAGIVMIDELVRPVSVARRKARRLLKGTSERPGRRQGDGEIGILLSPRYQGRGIALKAIGMLIRRLLTSRESDGQPLLSRVWAETASSNHGARKLLERIGLVLTNTAGDHHGPRFSRSGELFELVRYEQPATDMKAEPLCPALCVLNRIDANAGSSMRAMARTSDLESS